MATELLFSPYTLGTVELRNRVVMSPMTRNRCAGNIPDELVATYYGQRAEAGLIITEGTSPSPNGLGYARIPGLFSTDQVNGWKRTTKAVHAADGRIFAQLMHAGRVGHPANLPKGARLLAPSAVAAPGQMYTDTAGMQAHPVPEAMSEADIEATIDDYAGAAQGALDAGFDGVELHGANGYLIDQFLNTASNQRSDAWGGSVEGRTRFALQVAQRVINRIGKGRLGMRVSPYGVFNGMAPDAAMDALYERLATELSTLGLTYLHIVDHSSMGAPKPKPELVRKLRELFKGAYILSGGYDKARAEVDLQEKRGDLVAFGRPFIANPRLVTKLRAGTPLAQADSATFYTPGAKGYTDYPVE